MSMDELGPTGQAICKAYAYDKLDAPAAALVLELARCADTCDRLNALVIGKVEVWATMVFDDMGEVHLAIDKLLDQRRNQQLALKQLVAEVRAAKIKIDHGMIQTQTVEDPLAKRRREREERERKLG
jgi:hypothetical protein